MPIAMTIAASRRKPAPKALRAVPKEVHDTVAALLQLEAQPAPVLRKALALSEKQSDPRSLVRLAKVIGSHVVKLGQPAKPVGARAAGPRPQKDLRVVPADRVPTAADAMTGRRALAAAREVVSARALSDRLQVSPQALSKATRLSRMFTVEVDGERLYPAFFADPDLDRQQLEAVAKELRELPGWSKWQFFTTPKASLGGRTPLDALKAGKLQEVRRAAVGFAER
jgi:hypothetical protein